MSSIQDFYALNRQNLINCMPDKSAAVFFAAKPRIRSWDSHYPYCQNKNFFYLTGYEHPSAALMIKKLHNNVSSMLFVIHLTPKQIHWNGFLPNPEEASEITGIRSVFSMDTLHQHLFSTLKQVDSIFIDFQPVPPNEPMDDALQFVDRIRKTNPQITIQRVHNIMGQLRQIKRPEEIDRLSEAITLTRKGLDRMVRHIKPGVFEFEIDAHFNFELHVNRAQPAFQTIIATGKNATVLHYSSLNDRLKDNELILLDLGAEYQHYSADISRTFPVSGRFTQKQLNLYNLVLEANLNAIQAVEPGIPLSALNDVAKNTLANGMIKLGYINNPDDISKYFTHGVAHSLGLDAHDIVSDTFKTTQPGMVLTIEPGLYMPDEDIGIRIEDDILVTPNGHVNLSEQIPKHADDIVKWMSGD
jgi:Xaa-Pro aminopeptidase